LLGHAFVEDVPLNAGLSVRPLERPHNSSPNACPR